jgi:hypothetical protein
VEHFLSPTSQYDAHNAASDIDFLRKLFLKSIQPNTSPLELLPFTFSAEYSLKKDQLTTRVADNISSYQKLIKKGIVSDSMARKFCGSSIRSDHLEATFKLQGEEGIRKLLTEPAADGKPRITTSEPVISRILSFFKKLIK